MNTAPFTAFHLFTLILGVAQALLLLFYSYILNDMRHRIARLESLYMENRNHNNAGVL